MWIPFEATISRMVGALGAGRPLGQSRLLLRNTEHAIRCADKSVF